MSELLLAVRVILALGVVLLMLVGLSRWAAKRNAGVSGRTLPVAVVGRAALGRNAGVAVVEVGERLLVVGVAEQQVNLLTELPAAALPTGTTLEIPLLEREDDEDPAEDAALPVAAAPARLAPVPAGAGTAAGSRSGPATPTFEDALAAHSAHFPGDLAAPELPSRRRRAQLERAQSRSWGGRWADQLAGPWATRSSGHRATRPAAPSLPSGSGRAVSGSILDPDTWRRTARALKLHRS